MVPAGTPGFLRPSKNPTRRLFAPAILATRKARTPHRHHVAQPSVIIFPKPFASSNCETPEFTGKASQGGASGVDNGVARPLCLGRGWIV